MTRNDWIRRFALRYARLTGDAPGVARVVAETEANNLTWSSGESRAAWESPEEAAERVASDGDDD